MKATSYFKDQSTMTFPNVTERPVFQGMRNHTMVDGHKALVDMDAERTYAIVSDRYKLIPHQEVVDNLNQICEAFPEYGTPTREVWLSNYGARMKCRWTFPIDFEIKPGDIVHPTIEAMASFDTTLAQKMLVGGFRLVCSNGMVVGKILGEYKRKHTEGLNLKRAKNILSSGMASYSEANQLWQSYAEREALMTEVFAYEVLPFQAEEKAAIEREIKSKGKVLAWDEDDKTKRKVQINAWEVYNILTAQTSHTVKDITRQSKLFTDIASTFA